MPTKKQKYNLNGNEESEFPLKENLNLKNTFPFSVPAGYFEELPSKISERIINKSENGLFSHLTSYLQKPVYIVATSLILIAIVISSVLYFQENNSEDFLSDEITLEDVLEEYPYFIEDVSESEIIHLLLVGADEDFPYMDYYEIESIPDQDIIDFLMDENVNAELIYNL